MRALKGVLLASAMLGLAAGAAQAQVANSEWDIVGLKLGMTVDEANAALHAYNAGILTTTNYEVNEQLVLVNQRDLAKGLPGVTIRFKAPVEVFAAVLTHLYDQSGAEVGTDTDKPIFGAAGEFFRLQFVPTDDGGQLYRIVRSVVYSQGGGSKAALPEIAALETSIFAKYGKPAARGNSYDSWMTDARGRTIGTASRDFGRCLTGIGNLNVTGPVISQLDTAVGKQLITYKDIVAELNSLQSVVPDLEPSTDPNERARYKQCGVLLQFHYSTLDDTHAENLTMQLSDQSTAYFDNGQAKFAKDRLAAANAGQAPAATKF